MDKLDKLEAMLAPVAEAQGCELYDLEYLKEGSDRILRLYIDKADGIDLDDCERVSRAAEIVLDENDPISGEYRLQVSSPGVERKLKKTHHYTRFIGSNVSVKLFAPHCPISGRKKFVGELIGFSDNKIVIRTKEDNQEFTFDLQQVSSCKLQIFD